MSHYSDREGILLELGTKLSPIQFQKVVSLLDMQERISKTLIERKKLQRRLKKFIDVGDYRKVSLALDLTEEIIYNSHHEPEERLSILEERALIHCQSDPSFDYALWLTPEETLELRMLQNEECRQFGVDVKWPLESIQQYQLQHNL